MKPVLTLFIVLSSFFASAQDAQFIEVDSGSENNLYSVFFLNDNLGFAGGDSLILLKTVDGGNSWSTVEMQGIEPPASLVPKIKDILFVNELRGYVIAENIYGLLTTNDGGFNWEITPSTPGNMCYPDDIEVLGTDELIMVGTGCFQGSVVDHTIDQNWNTDAAELEALATVQALSINLLDAQVGAVTSTAGHIHLTSDGGENWESSNIAGVDSITGLVYLNADTLYASTNYYNSALYQSFDGGQNWSPEPNSLTFFYPALNGLTISDQSLVIFGKAQTGGNGYIAYNHLGSDLWAYQSFTPELNAGFAKPNGEIFVVGDDGIILRTEASLGIHDKAKDTEYSVFPNPTSTALNIVGLPDDHSDLKFTISNGIGQTVQKGPLTGNVIRLNNLASDIYYVEIFNLTHSFGVERIRIE